MTAWMAAWLCQGLAVTAGMWCVFKLTPNLNAATRYLLWWTALVVVAWIGYSTAPSGAPSTGLNALAIESGAAPLVLEIGAAPEWLLAAILSIWLSVTLIKLLRIIPELHALHRLQDACVEFPCALEQQLPVWMDIRSRGRRARLMVCDQLTGPAVIGLHLPCIAIPATLVRALRPADLDQIVVHEYAHVQRRDDWMRLLQVLLESALWIHPAARWIGRNISFERELACDDWVVSHTYAAKDYARCLAHAAELRGVAAREERGRLFMPALFQRKRDLVRRVDHLLDSRRNNARRLSVSVAVFGICVVLLSSMALRAFPLVVERLTTGALPAVGSPAGADRNIPALALLPPAVVSMDESVQPRAGVRPPRNRRRAPQEPVQTPAASAALVDGTMATSTSPFDPPAQRILEGKAFDGLYRTSFGSGAPDVAPNTGWAAAGAAGTSIGISARKATVGVAGAFSRAGVSLARSFH